MNSSDPEIQLVVFDLGRVLVQICTSWEQACQIADVPFPQAMLDVQVRDAVQRFADDHEHGRINLRQYTEMVAGLTGSTREQVARISNVWLRGAFPGARELVHEVTGSGGGAGTGRVKSACLSNTNDHHWFLMSQSDTEHRVPMEKLTWRFTSFELGVMKPHPDIFAHVEKTTKIQPAAILYFDDAPANIRAATGRGWRAVEIIHPGDTVEQMRQSLRKHGVL